MASPKQIPHRVSSISNVARLTVGVPLGITWLAKVYVGSYVVRVDLFSNDKATWYELTLLMVSWVPGTRHRLKITRPHETGLFLKKLCQTLCLLLEPCGIPPRR